MKLLLFVMALMMAFMACQSGSTSSDSGSGMEKQDMSAAMDESQAYESDQPPSPSPGIQKLIRNGMMTIKVADALDAKNRTSQILSAHDAYVGNEQFDNSDYSASYHMQIRVPAEKLDALIADLEQIDGEVQNKSINSLDVTEEFMDLETRLANKKAYVEQYREILKTARTVEDILKVREQIRVLEEEIESTEGRLKYLRNQVSLSTLNLTLFQQKEFVYKPNRQMNFFERLKESIAAGWFGFVEFCLVLLQLWPFWLALIILIWGVRKYTRRRKIIPLPPSQNS